MNEERSSARIRALINDSRLNDRQRQQALAASAEAMLAPPDYGPEAAKALASGIICDMREGNAPYRPRYVLPDYALALQRGCQYLELAPPGNLDEALALLRILYLNVPSITGYPVYLGNVDTLLDPFCQGVSDPLLRDKLRLFWRDLDRMLPDAFVHANLGPEETRVGMIMLALEQELRQVVPNLTLKCDARTSPAMLRAGVNTVFAVGKPHFVNHPLIVRDLGEDYGVVSCYNTLKIGGGAYTLVRLNLLQAIRQIPGDLNGAAAQEAWERFTGWTLDIMAARIRYLVEEAGFFRHHFLAREGLIDPMKFTAMFGVYGMAEAVNELLARAGRSAEKYGSSGLGAQFARQILEMTGRVIARRPLPYCGVNGGCALLHAQSGIDSDADTTAGVRIKLGEEPELTDHLLHQAPLHAYFPAGVSDIFHFDKTAYNNVDGVICVLRGAFAQGMRDFTFNIDDNEFVRVTGFIARRSEMAQVQALGARNNSAVLGEGTCAHTDILHGRKSRVLTSERLDGIHK